MAEFIKKVRIVDEGLFTEKFAVISWAAKTVYKSNPPEQKRDGEGTPVWSATVARSTGEILSVSVPSEKENVQVGTVVQFDRLEVGSNDSGFLWFRAAGAVWV